VWQPVTGLARSPKTVEVHLSRIYRKLGIRSRAELGRRLDQLGDGDES
jgi:DNA-binding NarL/FixJ family response regulator